MFPANLNSGPAFQDSAQTFGFFRLESGHLSEFGVLVLGFSTSLQLSSCELVPELGTFAWGLTIALWSVGSECLKLCGQLADFLVESVDLLLGREMTRGLRLTARGGGLCCNGRRSIDGLEQVAPELLSDEDVQEVLRGLERCPGRSCLF